MNTLKHSRGKNHHKTPTTDKREMTKGLKTVWFPRRLKLWPATSSVVTRETFSLWSVDDKRLRLRTEDFMWWSERRSPTRPRLFPWWSTSCGHVCKTRVQYGGECSLITNYVYVQIVYKTQSENSIKSSTVQAQRGSTNAMTSIKSKLKCF